MGERNELQSVLVKPFQVKGYGVVYEVLPYIFIPEQFIQPSLFEPVRQASLMFIRNPAIEPISNRTLGVEEVGEETLYAAIELLKESIGHGPFFNPNQGDVFEPVIDLPPLIAHAIHLYQVDKLGVPYIDHPKNVARNTEHAISANPKAFSDEQIDTAIAAAWLHDVIEDSAEFFYRPLSQEDLFCWGINNRTLDIVSLMTRSKEVESKDYYWKLLQDPIARMVKLADIAHNTNVARVAALDASKREKLGHKYSAALEILEYSPKEDQWFQARVEAADNSDCPFSPDESAKAFAMATSLEPLPKRFKGILGESEMSNLVYKVKDVLTQETFSDQDSDLDIVMALLWQFYRLEYPGDAPYNSALVAEFYERKAKHLAAGAGSALNSNYALHELTLAELIKRARRSIQLLEKYNLPMLTDEQQVDFQDHLIWPNSDELSRDEAAELLFVAYMEMEASSDRRVEIHDIKGIIINCLELMKFRGIAMYKYACYSSKEEYDTTAEEDAEIFGCVAHSEEEADEIVGAKHYWLSVLIGIQAAEDLSPE